MTDKQLNQAKKQLHEEMNALGFGWRNGTFVKPTKEYVIRNQELWCIDMINSILAYGCFGIKDAEKVMQTQEQNYHNYLADYVKDLGRDRVITLIQGQIDSIARIQHCVFKDSDGLTYNSIVWKEETK